MKEPNVILREALRNHLKTQGYDVDLVPLPTTPDRMVRLRTLEELLDELDSDESGGGVGYIVHLKQGAAAASERNVIVTSAKAESQSQAKESIYLPDGKLNVPFLSKNAELLFAAGEFALAKNIYLTLKAAGERTGQSLYWIGRCLDAEGALDEARKSYEEAILYQPTVDAYRHFSAVLIRLRRDHEAAEALERALNLKEADSRTRLEMHKACGNCWMRAGKGEAAQRHYLAAVELDPQNDAALTNLGVLYLEAGQLPEAKQAFQQAISSNPKNDKALCGLSQCAISAGESRLAHDLLVQALEVKLNNPSAVAQLVKCAYEIKSYAAAARLLGEYVQIAPVSASLLYSLAGLQFHLGRISEAKGTAEQILRIQPSHAGAVELMSLIDRYASPR